jgi:ribose 5-phosphate isomerase B
MRIHISANHKGFAQGREVQAWLAAAGHEVIWHGAAELDPGDDYTHFAILVGQSVIVDEDHALETRGLVFGGTGASEIICVNKVNGVRAVAAVSQAYVHDARQLSNANVLVLGAELSDLDFAKNLISTLIETSFEYTVENARRIVNVNEYENVGTIEGWMITEEELEKELGF